MRGSYTLRVMTDFASAHILHGYPGACSRMHGHNWKVEVEAKATSLDELGMAVDFKILKDTAQTAVKRLDHRYLNEIPPFDEVNPTAENIASHLYHELCDLLNDERIRVAAVTLWETERACVRYAEEAD